MFTFKDAEREFTRKAKRNEYMCLDSTIKQGARLYRDGDKFVVALKGNPIVAIYPDHYELLEAIAWLDTQSTQLTVNRIVHCLNFVRSKGYRQYIRVNGYPFFPGIRLTTAGKVFPEDIRSDERRLPDPEVAKQYTITWRRISKQLYGRFMLGEFTDPEVLGIWRRAPVSKLLAWFQEVKAGMDANPEYYISKEMAAPLLLWGWYDHLVDKDAVYFYLLTETHNELRQPYFDAVGAMQWREVKNG